MEVVTCVRTSSAKSVERLSSASTGSRAVNAKSVEVVYLLAWASSQLMSRQWADG